MLPSLASELLVFLKQAALSSPRYCTVKGKVGHDHRQASPQHK
jgi:hypothetical protein